MCSKGDLIRRSTGLLASWLAAAAVLTGCGGSDGGVGAGSGRSARIPLDYFDEHRGTATVESINDGSRTRVVIEMDEPLAGGRALLRVTSSCLELGTAVLVGLKPVEDGRSETELNLSFESLRTRDASVWVHTSADEEEFYACGELGEEPPPQVVSVRKAAAIAACYEPGESYGLERGACSRIVKLERLGDDEWRLQLRRPPTFCVRMHLGERSGDPNVDVRGLGTLFEVRCPASAYPNEPAPDVRLRLREPLTRRRAGVASLTAVGARSTRVLVNADAEHAWIRPGRCGKPASPETRTVLEPFWSERSLTTLPVSLRSLTSTPHVLEIVGEVAVGGLPAGCVGLSPR